MWASDETTKGFDVTGLEVFQDDIVIVPKLFRRLVDYLHLGDDSMTGFPGAGHNTRRLHGFLNDVPPTEFEATFYATKRTDQPLVEIQ